MKTIQINNKKFSATNECVNILKANSNSNEVLIILINLSLLTGSLIEL